MKRAFQTTIEAGSITYTPDELIAYLIDAEYDDKHNRKIERLTKAAKFRYKANVEEIIFLESRNIEKNKIFQLADCNFIKKAENILITGSTSVGKSYIASALGHQACNNGHRVLYFNTNKLFTILKMAKADGSYLKWVDRIEKQDVLILDDFGMKPLDSAKRHFLMDIIEDRHARKATIIASQLPVVKWHETIGEGTVADAILDRIVHNAHRLELTGESMRKNNQKNNTFVQLNLYAF